MSKVVVYELIGGPGDGKRICAPYLGDSLTMHEQVPVDSVDDPPLCDTREHKYIVRLDANNRPVRFSDGTYPADWVPRKD